jgi:hypothetical protein
MRIDDGSVSKPGCESPSRSAGLVIGARNLEAGNVSVRLHGKGNTGAKAKGEVIADILAAIKERGA